MSNERGGDCLKTFCTDSNDSLLIRRAAVFAIKAHGEQKYGDKLPYMFHLTMAVAVLHRFGVATPQREAAVWLHDTLEDTTATYEELAAEFGTHVADIVAAVTEPKGGNRKWRHEQTYPRILANEDARIVKLCDRIANVEAGGKLTGMYRKEHAEFKRALFQDPTGPERRMWDFLDWLLT